MAGQHTENLFRRFKGQSISVKTITGGMYQGRVVEVTNDYVCLSEIVGGEGAQVFLFFHSIESMTATDSSTV
jgi:ribosome maturation factor RimP